MTEWLELIDKNIRNRRFRWITECEFCKFVGKNRFGRIKCNDCILACLVLKRQRRRFPCTRLKGNVKFLDVENVVLKLLELKYALKDYIKRQKGGRRERMAR